MCYYTRKMQKSFQIVQVREHLVFVHILYQALYWKIAIYEDAFGKNLIYFS